MKVSVKMLGCAIGLVLVVCSIFVFLLWFYPPQCEVSFDENVTGNGGYYLSLRCYKSVIVELTSGNKTKVITINKSALSFPRNYLIEIQPNKTYHLKITAFTGLNLPSVLKSGMCVFVWNYHLGNPSTMDFVVFDVPKNFLEKLRTLPPDEAEIELIKYYDSKINEYNLSDVYTNRAYGN